MCVTFMPVGLYPHARQDRDSVKVWHADIRGSISDDSGGLGAEYSSGHWGRSLQWHKLCGLLGEICG